MPAAKQPEIEKLTFDSLEQEVFLNLWRTYDCLKAVEENLLNQHGLSAQQYNALRLLRSVHPNGMPTQELGRRFISRNPDTTRVLDRLEKQGLVKRDRRPDNRRVVEISITRAGLKLLDKMATAVEAMHEQQLGHLPLKEKRQLVKLLKRTRRPHEDATCDWLNE